MGEEDKNETFEEKFENLVEDGIEAALSKVSNNLPNKWILDYEIRKYGPCSDDVDHCDASVFLRTDNKKIKKELEGNSKLLEDVIKYIQTNYNSKLTGCLAEYCVNNAICWIDWKNTPENELEKKTAEYIELNLEKYKAAIIQFAMERQVIIDMIKSVVPNFEFDRNCYIDIEAETLDEVNRIDIGLEKIGLKCIFYNGAEEAGGY